MAYGERLDPLLGGAAECGLDLHNQRAFAGVKYFDDVLLTWREMRQCLGCGVHLQAIHAADLDVCSFGGLLEGQCHLRRLGAGAHADLHRRGGFADEFWRRCTCQEQTT